MLDYTFVCPHCKREARIVERASVVRDTNLIGFNRYNYYAKDEYDPEFSVFDEFGDEPDSIDYFCSLCEKILDVTFEGLYGYVKQHGTIEEEKTNG